MQPQQNPDSGDLSSGASDRPALARIQNSLKDRRAEMTRMMAEMRDLYHSGRSQAQVEIESLRHEKQQIQQLLDQQAKELADLTDHSRATEERAKEAEQHYQNVLADAEAALADQGDEIARLVAEFKQSKTEPPGTSLHPLSQADVATLAPQAMRDLVKSTQADIATQPPQVTREITQSTKRIAELEEELSVLRGELGQRDQLIQEFHAQQYAARLTASTHPAELEKLQGELSHVHEQHKAAQEKLASMAPPGELEKLRGELTRAREELTEANRKAATAATMAPAADVEKLRSELVRSREELSEANRKAATSPAPSADAEKLRSELVRMREQLQEANRKAAAALTMVPAAEAEKLRNELVRTREQLQETKNKLSAAPAQLMAPSAIVPAELDRLQKELTKLKVELAEKEKALRSSVPASDVEKLISELGRARGEMAKLKENPSTAPNAMELDQLRAELTILQEELREKDRELQELHADGSGPHPTDNEKIAKYEAELIRYHRQLETDRQTLNGSIEQLEKRNAELAQAAQKAQQDLAGERAQLNQLRDELHIDLAFEDLAFLARKHLAPIQPAKKK